MGTHTQSEAFEAGLLDHPDDLTRWGAYSDYLAEQGDPRGEFMRVQLALEDESLSAADRKKLKRAEADLLAAHEREWLGPLAAFTVDAVKEKPYPTSKQPARPPVLHTFEKGWLRKVEFPHLSVNQARALVACAEARLLRELVAVHVTYDDQFTPGPDVPAGVGEYEGPALYALGRCPHLGAVRRFVLGDPEDQCHTPGEAACHLMKQMPRVEEAEFYARNVDTVKLFALPMPNLKKLTVFHVRRYPLDKLAANATLTKLETLQCHPHALDYSDDEGGAYIGLKHLRAICRSPHLKTLTHLCLRITDFGDDGVKEIIQSGMLERLKVLDLRAGCISDDGAARLAASKHLKKLEFLNLYNNALSADGVKAIQATKVNADLTSQHTSTSAEIEDGQLPEFLFDGDIE
jgi:uncharacterized protein (TIGR02996 family)